MRNLTNEFETAIENENQFSELEEITSRQCESDRFSGVQYNFFGRHVPVRPIIDVVAETDGMAIETVAHTHDGDHICLGVFIADIPEQSHPAFVE